MTQLDQWCGARQCWHDGTYARMIYAVPDGFVIAENDQWLPGVYADRETAARAFEHGNETLQMVQDLKLASGSWAAITANDLPVKA